MLKAMSTYVNARERLHPGLLDGLARGGAQAIEIFAARGHFDYTNPQHIREIGGWFKSSGVELHSMHSPMYDDDQWGRSGAPAINIACPERKGRIEAMDEIKRAIEVAETVPFRFLVQHIGISGEEFDEHRFDATLTSLEHLHAFAKPLGVRILVENIPNELSTPEKLLQVIRVGHFEDMGVCFDIGHAHLLDGVEPTFDRLKDYIRSTHIHDNMRDHDSHSWPGTGNIDWDNAMNLLRTAPQVPAMLMEINGDPNGDLDYSRLVPGKMQEAWKKLESAGPGA